MNYTHTLVGLEQRAQFHQRHLKLIEQAVAALEAGADLVYQVHYQQAWPSQRAIMAEDSDPQVAVEKAERLWQAYNPGQRRRAAELFVRVDTIRIAIDPLDTREGFTLDKRIADWPAPMVFGPSEKLPSAWYASAPTPEPEPAAVPA